MIPLRIKPFCAWGDGPDVGINVYDEADELIGGADYTPEQAEELAYELIGAAEQARELDRLWAEQAEERHRALEECE